MRRRILILAALAAAAAALSLVEIASGQTSPPAAGVPPAPQPSAPGQTATPQTWSHPGAVYPFLPPSPYDGAGRPGSASYRYDALGRIVEIVRIPAR
jgi:hypothetical protein